MSVKKGKPIGPPRSSSLSSVLCHFLSDFGTSAPQHHHMRCNLWRDPSRLEGWKPTRLVEVHRIQPFFCRPSPSSLTALCDYCRQCIAYLNKCLFIIIIRKLHLSLTAGHLRRLRRYIRRHSKVAAQAAGIHVSGPRCAQDIALPCALHWTVPASAGAGAARTRHWIGLRIRPPLPLAPPIPPAFARSSPAAAAAAGAHS